MSSHAVQCDPSESDWYVDMVIGMTYCPQTLERKETCTHREDLDEGRGHDHEFGTETDSAYAYYKGARPDFDAIKDSLVGPPWYVLEYKILRCPNPADESVCRWCSDDIVFAQDGDTRWGTDGDPDATVCGANPEDDRHQPVDEYNES